MKTTTNRLAQDTNGHAQAGPKIQPVQWQPMTATQDVAALQHKAEQALIEVRFARRQLAEFKDHARADKALEVAEKVLRDLLA